MNQNEPEKKCSACEARVEEWNAHCGACGFHLVLEPNEALRARYLRGPSLGALFFTQGFALGSRLYLLFVMSLIPIVGILALVVGVMFGRRWSWKHGGWNSWEEFMVRMKLLDIVGIVWICLLIVVYVWRKSLN